MVDGSERSQFSLLKAIKEGIDSLVDNGGGGGDSALLQSVDSTLTSILASTSLAGVVLDTSKLANGASDTLLTPKFAKISCSLSGVNTIVTAVALKKIRVVAWELVIHAAVNFKWQSHVTPTDITGLYEGPAQGWGLARSFCPVGYFETVAGEALDLNLSGAVAVGGSLVYVEV